MSSAAVGLRWRSLRAGPLLSPLVAVVAALVVAAGFWPAASTAASAAASCLLVALALELRWLRRVTLPTMAREAPSALALGRWHEIVVRVQSGHPSALALTFSDRPPAEDVEVDGLRQELVLPPGLRSVHRWRLRPTRRGDLAIAPAEAVLAGRLRLLGRHLRLGEPHHTRVYPDFGAVAQLAGLASGDGASGAHLRRRRGHGSEFHQLRDYMESDPPRHIDWKAVARRGRLTSREFREEQNQRVLFLVDCGRRMQARDGELSLLDRTLNAMLLLSYVALRQGDSIAMLTYGGVDRWLPETRGGHAMPRLVRATYDLQPTLDASDIDEAISRLMLRQRRRSLVVLLTNLGDDDSADLPRLLAPIRRRHLALVASLRDPILRAPLRAPPTSFDDALLAASTLDYLHARAAAHATVQSHGVHLLDVEPEALPRAIVARYQRIKRAGLL